MTKFNYTRHFDGDSSLVKNVYYDSDTEECVVDLGDNIYKYSGVPVRAFNDFDDAISRGRYYNVFKRTYGPGEYLGGSYDVDFVASVVAMPVSPERANAYSRPEAYVSNNNYYATGGYIGTPKDLKVTEDTVVDGERVGNSSGASVHYGLTAPVSNVRRHAVTFEVNGAKRVHTLKVESVDEAVDAVEQIADMLDLEFDIKECTVYFD